MKKFSVIFSCLLFSLIVFSSVSFPQLKKIGGNNLFTESDIFVSSEGVRYSDQITLKFNKHVINNNLNPMDININDLNLTEVKDFFLSIRKKYGNFKIAKGCPGKFWGDTIAVNKRTKKQVNIPDFSQLVILKFKVIVPVDSIVSNLLKQDFIAYAEAPKIMSICSQPNDPLYSSAAHWAFDRIDAEKAWDITKGSSSILIGINDKFWVGSQPHEDLADKIYYAGTSYYQDHGGSVAGIAAATTNNNIGLASLGWNLKLVLTDWFANGINEAVAHGADVINMSWITQQSDYQDVRDAIHSALLQGVVVVAAAGNQTPENVDYIPSVQYPAAYNFGSDGQVIAVSATQWDGSNETFVDGWNYSPGTDPINDPTNSFIDVSAPGKNIEILTNNNGYSPNGAGTSDAAPFVSALCGLILSVNPSLTPNLVYEIISHSTDKIGQYSYDGNGWNRYMGYGRINAYKALKYTFEHYGGILTQDLIIPSNDTWNLDPGITIEFPSSSSQFPTGYSIVANGTLNALGTSANQITFTSNDSYPHSINLYGSNNNLQYCNMSRLTTGLYVNNSSTNTIDHCNITNCGWGIYCFNTSMASNSVRITNSNVSNNQTGIALLNASADISYSNFNNNSASGIYVEDGTVYSDHCQFENNEDYGFHIGGASGYGVMSARSLSPGHNIVYNNNGGGSADEVLANGYGNIFIGQRVIDGLIIAATNNNESFLAPPPSYTDYAGYNDIYFGAHQNAQEKLIDNQVQDIIFAQLVYWNQNPPSSNYFNGSVHYSYYLGSPSSNYSSVITSDEPIVISSSAQKSINSLNSNSDFGKYNRLYNIVKNDIDLSKGNALMNFKLLSTLIEQMNLSDQNKISFEDYVNGKDSKNIPAKTQIAAEIMKVQKQIEKKKYDHALALLNEISSNNSNNPDGTIASYVSRQKLSILIAQKKYTEAENLFQNIQNENLFGSDEIELFSELFNIMKREIVETNSNSLLSKGIGESEINKTPYLLSQNYPNPFNPTTIISYYLPTPGHVYLKIYDILGKEVATLVDKAQSKGSYDITFNASSLASGIYIYQLRVNDFITNRKLILMK